MLSRRQNRAEQAVLLYPMENHTGADIHAVACGEPCLSRCVQMCIPEGSCSTWRGVHAGAGFLSGTVARGEPVLEQSVPEGENPLKGSTL